MDGDENKQKALLDQFLADNDELEQLSAYLATFNVFRVLKVEKAEIRHSNVLAWLLDPAESHGLRDVFLRRILSNILIGRGAEIEELSAAQIELMEFSDIEVRREWKRIDLLVIDRKNKLILLIENKIDAGETPGQLRNYRKAVRHEFPAPFKLVPIFLTLEGEPCEDDEAVEDAGAYNAYSHAKLLGVLERIIDQRQKQMPEAVFSFLTQYQDTLRRLTMPNKELVELCKHIYRKHKDAITLIVKYGERIFGQLALEVVERDVSCEILKTFPSEVWFIPKSWANVVPMNSTAWTYLPRPLSVACWVSPVSILGASSAKLQENRQKSRDVDAREKSIRAPRPGREWNGTYRLSTLMSSDGTLDE